MAAFVDRDEVLLPLLCILDRRRGLHYLVIASQGSTERIGDIADREIARLRARAYS